MRGYTCFVDTDGKTKHVLYATKIVEFNRLGPSGSIQLNNGGWQTMHTKKCMNHALISTPWRVIQKKGQWYVKHLESDAVLGYVNNMILQWHPKD